MFYIPEATNAVLLALAAVSLCLNALCLWLIWHLSRRIDNLPRPFWMGEWPPRFMNPDEYDYSHLDFSWMKPGQTCDLGRGLRIDASAKLRSPAPQTTEQAARTEKVETAVGGDVNGLCNAQSGPDAGLGHRADPNDDALARLQQKGKGDPSALVHLDRELRQPGPHTPDQTVGRSEPSIGHRHVQEAVVGDADTDHSISRVLKHARELAVGDANVTLGIDTKRFSLNYRVYPQSHTVLPKRPNGVDDTQRCAEQRNAESHSLHHPTVRHPSAP